MPYPPSAFKGKQPPPSTSPPPRFLVTALTGVDMRRVPLNTESGAIYTDSELGPPKPPMLPYITGVEYRPNQSDVPLPPLRKVSWGPESLQTTNTLGYLSPRHPPPDTIPQQITSSKRKYSQETFSQVPIKRIRNKVQSAFEANMGASEVLRGSTSSNFSTLEVSNPPAYGIVSRYPTVPADENALSRRESAIRSSLENLGPSETSLFEIYSDRFTNPLRRVYSPFDHNRNKKFQFHCCSLLNCNEACDVIEVICSDKLRYRKLLDLKGITAQYALDVMQMTLDCDSAIISTQSRTILLKAILRLAKRSMLYPRSFVLTHVDRSTHPVASGHFGEVYQGNYNSRKVSLKAFKLYLSQMSERQNLLKAFYKEAILWRHFDHRNLLPFYGIYQLGDSGRRICLVSPWMDNGNISEYLTRNTDVNRYHLTSDIAQSIAYLHEQSVIHGDLKGANILISNSGVACLADFGLSSIACKHSLTWTSVETTVSTAGTVRWQAPELLEENSLGATKESDMYAFARIYIGKVPFYEYKVEPAVIRQIMLGKRPTRPELNSDSCISWGLTDWIWSLIEECWHEDPAVRLTASEVVEKLSLVAGFSRPDATEWDSWGELRSKAFKSLVDRQSKMTEEEMKRAISFLKSL